MRRIILLFVMMVGIAMSGVVEAQTCKTPENFALTSLSANSATVIWDLSTTGDYPDSYFIRVTSSGGTVVVVDSNLVAPSQSYTITGLSVSTTYTVELSSTCNLSGISGTETFTFSTPCAAQAAPYTEDFNSAAPACTYTRNAVWSNGGRTGKCMELTTTATDEAYIVFPSVSLSSNNIEATVWMKANSVIGGNIQVMVGIVTDPADIDGTFEPLYTGSLSSTTWTEVRMNTSATQLPVTTSAMIAVLIPNSASNIVYIDDVVIRTIPTCIRPENFAVSNVTATSATFSWTTATSNVKLYLLSDNDTRQVIANTNPYTISNLVPNTAYSIQIRAICSPSDSSDLNPVTLSVRTECVVADSTLFIQNFDNLTIPNALPDCWKEGWFVKPAANTKIYPFAATTDRAHSGSRSMTLVKQEDGSVAYLTTQAIPIDQSGKYTLSVWIYRQEVSGAQEEGLKFWVSSNPYDTTGATLLGYIPRHYLAAPAENFANEWYNYEFIINTTGTKYIIIEGISQDAAQVCFDDLEVKMTPSCFKVSNVTMGTPTYNSVGFTWTPGRNEQQWIVSYSVNDGQTVTDTVSTPAITITGLTAATSYSIEGTITSYCGAGDMSVPVAFSNSFVTTCQPLSFLPYSCGFESGELTSVAAPLPLCWMRYNDATGADNTHPQASTSTAYSHTGTGYLKFLPATSSVDYGEHQVAILPQLNTTIYPINTLRLVFYGQATTIDPAPVITVGVMSNPADYSTFVAIDSFTVGTTSYLRYEANLSNYTGSGTYVALMSHRIESAFVSLNIDDIRLEPIPACSDLEGAGVTVSDITDHVAKLTVSDLTATTWSFAYGVAGTPLSACTVVDTVNGTSITLNNLSTQTSYVVYARRRCGNQFGSWSSAVTFRTACGAFNIPYTDDFESYTATQLTGCYYVATDNNYLNVCADGSGSTGTYNHTANGSKGLALSNDASSQYPVVIDGNVTMAIYVHLEAGRNYEISIYAKAESNGFNLSFLSGTTSSNLGIISTALVTSTSWGEYKSYFTPGATGDYYLGVRTSPLTSRVSYHLHLDDISISEVSCVPPTSSILSQLGSTTATIGFTSAGTMWDVAVSSTPIVTSSVTGNVYRDTITANSFSLSNLNVNTTYYYTIRTLCGSDGNSQWMTPQSFHTRCTTANVPYSQGFETSAAITCWTPLNGVGSVARETSVRYTGTSSMRATTATVVSPEFNVTTFAPYMLSGWARTNADSAVVTIGVMTDPDDASAIEIMGTAVVTPANTWVEITSYFSLLNDPDYSDFYNARYIVLGTGNSTVYFDDLAIDIAPSCNRPNQGSVTAVTGHGATIDWVENGSATQWQVSAINTYGIKTTQIVNSHPYTLTNLNPATSYAIYVRSICSEGDTSIAFKIGDITTECDYVTAPYSENFEAFAVSSTPQCWDISQSSHTSTYNNHPDYIWGVYTQGGNKSIRLYNAMSSAGDAIIVTPEIVLTAGSNYAFSYDYCHQASSGAFQARIKRHSASNFTILATHYNNGSTDASTPSAFITNSIGLQNYVGDTVQFMFANQTNWQSGSIWVDNVRVRELSACAELTALTVQDVTANSVIVAFTDTAASHTQWQYAVVQAGHDVSEATPVNVTSKMVIIPNLLPSTTYEIYVRAVCSASDFSSWVSVTQKTLALPAVLPYVTDFSNTTQNSDWKRIGGGTNDFTFGNDGNATFATGSHAMYISNDGFTYNYDANSATITGIARLFSFSESSYSIEFDWKCPGGENVSDFARYILAPASADLVPTYSSAAIYRNYVWPDNIIALDNDQAVCLVDGGSQHFSQVIDMTGRSGDYYLVFYWINDGNGGTVHYPFSVSNLSVAELLCEPVVNLAVDESSISYSSATATFNNPNVGSDIRWAVSTSALITDTIKSGVTLGESVTVNGLNPSTMYYLFVRAECNALDRSPWEYVQFQTECAPVTTFPLTESFESLTFPPICWSATTLTSVTTSHGVVDGRWEQATRNTHSGTKSAKLEGDPGTSALLSTPALMLDPDREYHVSFWLMQSGSSWNTDEVNVYVGTNATSTDGATSLAHYVIYNRNHSGNSLANFDIDLPAGLSGEYYVLFEAIDVTNGYIYLDDVTVDIYPPCRNLTTQPTIVATTATTASLTIPMGMRTSIKYGIAPYSSSPQPSQITTEMTTTTGDVTFTGLTAGTSYSVFARGYCADGDSTSWTTPVTVITKADDCFAPENIHVVGSVSNTAATIAWSSVPNSGTYQCIIAGDTAIVATNQVAYTTLSPLTNYTLMIRGICGVGDTTAWSSFSFRTISTPATIPYTTGFEATDDNTLWQKLSSGYANNFLIGNDSEGHCSGSRGLYISSDGRSYSQSVPTNPTPRYGVNLYNVTYYTRTLYFAAAGNYEVSFDWKCNPEGTSSYEAYGRAFVAPATATLPVDDDTYLRNLPAGSYALGTNLSNSSTWQRTSSIFTIDAPQYMNLVFMWIGINVNGYSDPDEIGDYPLAIDNVSVSEVSCLPVNSVVALSVQDTSATILVTQPEAVAIEYAVMTTYSLDSVAVTTIDNALLRDTITLTGLEAATNYYFVARQVCDSADRSSWKILTFTTTATPAVVPYVCDFEDTTENANWFYTQAQPNYFTIGTSTSYGGTHSLYITSDGSSYNYDNTALSFAYAHRIISLQEGLYEYSYDWKCNGENNDDGARVFLIPADVQLFKNSWLNGLSYTTVPKNAIAIDNGFMYGQNSYTQQSGSFWITEGKLYNIVVAWRNGTGGGSNPPVSVDNISITSVNCLPPVASVIKSSVGESTASVAVTNRNENSALVYALATSSDIASAFYYDTLPYAAIDTVVLTNLSASSSYYVHLRSLCDSTDESYWTSVQFKTLCGEISLFPYSENFENLSATTGYVANAANAFCWSAINAVSAKPFYNITTTDKSDGVNSLRLVSSNTAPLYMLLPEMDDLNNLYLTFRSKFSSNTNSAGTLTVGYLTDDADGDSFVSVSNATRAATWTAQSAIFTNVPAGARMALRYSGAANTSHNVYVDAVRVSRLVNGAVYNDTICNTTNYMMHGFAVRYTALTVGDNTLTRVVQSSAEGSSDTLVTANVHRLADIITSTVDTICSGQPYTRGMWNIASPTTRLYTQTFRGASVCGCDSTVQLNLTVIPVNFTIIDTICHNGSYLFGDSIITAPGKYTRSYLNTYGCTCTDTLYLMMLPDSIFDVDMVCRNNLPYVWRGQNITTAGRHTVSLTGPRGCAQIGVLDLTIIETDSIVTLNICQGGSAQVVDTFITTAGTYTIKRIEPTGGCFVTYHITATIDPAVPVDVYDYACEGYPYTGNGITGLTVTADTVVTVTSRTIDARCDSITNVHISFVPTVTNEIYATINKGESYYFDGSDRTESGDYVGKFRTVDTNCDSIVTLHLTVLTGIDNVTDIRMEIVPNPIETGAVAYIYGDFEQVVSVEVINGFGQVVDTFVPSSYPIEISGIQAAGIYNIRVTTTDGRVHVRKLIIK